MACWPVHRYPKSFSERRAVPDGGTTPGGGTHRLTGGLTQSRSRRRFRAPDMRLAGLRPFGYAVEGRSLFLKGLARIVYGEHALDSYWRLAGVLGDPTPVPPRVQSA